MKGIELLSRDGRAVLHEGAFAPGGYERLRDALDWREERVRIFGRLQPVPRLVAWYGERAYAYSGVRHAPRPLPEPLRELRTRVEDIAGHAFDAVLGNWYRSGRDSMGYHRDDEPEIDPACIASLSFGATRRFKLRHRASREVVTVELTDGSLLLMLDCQAHWEHAVPKTRRPVGGRINLTFRKTRAPS